MQCLTQLIPNNTGKFKFTYLLSRDRSVIYICTYQLLLPH